MRKFLARQASACPLAVPGTVIGLKRHQKYNVLEQCRPVADIHSRIEKKTAPHSTLPPSPSFCTHFVDKIVSKGNGMHGSY